MRRTVVAFLATMLACVVWGQEFEVVSIRPNTSGSGDSRANTTRGGLVATNVSLRSLVTMAYGIKGYQLDAPEWLRSARFDITAKPTELLPKDREKYNDALHAMMQKDAGGAFQTGSSP